MIYQLGGVGGRTVFGFPESKTAMKLHKLYFRLRVTLPALRQCMDHKLCVLIRHKT